MEGCLNYDNVVSYLRDLVGTFDPLPTDESNSLVVSPVPNTHSAPPPPPPPQYMPDRICIIPPPPTEHHRYDNFAIYGPDIKTIAKLLESQSNIPFSSSIIEYLKTNPRTSRYAVEYEQEIHKFSTACAETNNIYKFIFIRKLFEYHAALYNITIQQAIKKFLPQLEEHYTKTEYTCVHTILRDVEWEWIDEEWLHPAKHAKI